MADPIRAAALLPGLAACAAIALATAVAAETAAGARFGTAVLAMAAGIAVANLLPTTRRLDAGAAWVVRAVLPLGIVLLGARVEIRDLAALSAEGLGLAILVVAIAALLFTLLARAGVLSPRMAALLAVGSSICGGSAIAAASPILGAKREETAASVSAVVLVGTVGTILLPILGDLFEMSDRTFGLWAGLSLQQTPQVIAAGMARGPAAGEIATAVKLVRIALLVPATFALAMLWRRERTDPSPPARRLVPVFLWGFLALSCAGTLSLLPTLSWTFDADSPLGGCTGAADLRELASLGSGACLVAAMAAIGLQTRLSALRDAGPRALVGASLAAVAITTTIGLILPAA